MRRQNQIEDNECHRDKIAQTRLYIKRMHNCTCSLYRAEHLFSTISVSKYLSQRNRQLTTLLFSCLVKMGKTSNEDNMKTFHAIR